MASRLFLMLQVLVNISPTYPTGYDNTGGTKDLC